MSTTLTLDFTTACLVEEALKKEIKSKFKWYRRLQELRRDGLEVAPAQFANQLFFVEELNKQRRVLRAATAI